MAKDPAFLFYPGDWLGGTIGMTLEEKGAYIELLVTQFNRGHMTEDMIGRMIGQCWGQIKDKFMVDANGLYYNARLELEQEKRKEYSQSRRNNVLGINQYTKKTGHMTKHTEGRMEDRDEDKNVLEEIGSEKVKIIANDVWADVGWRESICMGLSITMEELKKWLALFNSSISNEKIENFDKGKYKKMSRGWISTQQGKGVKVETNISRKSDSAPLKILQHGI